MNMHVGSQWFAIPRHVVEWFLIDPLAYHYQSYAQYVVIADENYFSTLISNSPYCSDIVRKNNLFLLFDKWENEIDNSTKRDNSKCLSRDPNHCGRSPFNLTMKFESLLKLSQALFARKFDPLSTESMKLVDAIDSWRMSSTRVPPSTISSEGRSMMIRFSGYSIRNTFQNHNSVNYHDINTHTKVEDQDMFIDGTSTEPLQPVNSQSC